MNLSTAHKGMTSAECKVHGLHFIAFLEKRGAIQNGCTQYSKAEKMLKLYNVCYPELKMDFPSLANYLYKLGYILQLDSTGVVKFNSELPQKINAIGKKAQNVTVTSKSAVSKFTKVKPVQKIANSKTKKQKSTANKTSQNEKLPRSLVIRDVCMAADLKLKPYFIPKPMLAIFHNNMKPLPEMTEKHTEHMKNISNVLSKKELEPNMYISQLKTLQYMEEHQLQKDMRQFDLDNHKIQPSKLNGNHFLIYVPGLTEDRPSVRRFDEIYLSQVGGENKGLSIVSYVAEKHVRTDARTRFRNNFSDEQRYKVRFLLPRRTIRCCQHAIELVDKNKLVPALFPKIASSYNKPKIILHWYDENIANNPEQQQAVCNIVAQTAHPLPYLLFGPPGTGKTATVVEAISQIWETEKFSHVLVCTPSNAAADEVTKRLLKNKIPPNEIYRMYGPSRQWNDVDETIKPCSNFVNGEIIFLPRDLIILKKIVVVTLMSCARLLALHLRENHFSYVFVDEGGQATEPETLIPVGLMSGKDEGHRGRLHGQLILAGDPKQLGPSVRSVHAKHLLEKSMLERLMDQCAQYKKDETGKYNPTFITKLVQNFRSNQCILHVPNVLFYENELIACGGADTQRAMQWSTLPKTNFPLIFHAIEGEEKREEYSPSVCNMNEVAVIMDYVEKLIGEKLGGRKLLQKDIGIVTPYRLQRAKISEALAKRHWNDVSVGTVEIFQGQERDVIILSTVRSVIFRHAGEEHLGFLSNPKRFNVAVTRAKSLLITVGNPKVLQVDECWLELMRYCKKNNACRGIPFSVDQKLSAKEKRKLIAKKFIPKKFYWDTNAQLPIEEGYIIKPTNEILENEAPRRRRRKPKIVQTTNSPPSAECDSGITSSSNSSTTTDTGSHSSSFSNTGNSEVPSISDETASIHDVIATGLDSGTTDCDLKGSSKSLECSSESSSNKASLDWETTLSDSGFHNDFGLSYVQNKLLDMGFDPTEYDYDSDGNLIGLW